MSTGFSFEILPPLKGNSIYNIYDIIDSLREFEPEHINITAHHSEVIYKELPDGNLRRVSVKKRPGTVAIAAAIQNKYGITAVPHIICKGFTKEETEYALIDLNFLGITNLCLLRGDAKSAETVKQDPAQFHQHATDLQEQVNRFNRGELLDGTPIHGIDHPFTYGMACYPEKHEEAPNMESDIRYARMKVDNGASYLVTQMFFDNAKYFEFVDRCRAAGITVPIIPGIKPIVRRSQLTILPRVFRTDIPEELASALRACPDDEHARQVGIDWAIAQSRDLIAHDVPSLHFFTINAAPSVRAIASAVL